MSAKRRRKACPDLSGSGGGNSGDAEPLDGLSAAQSRAVTAVAYEPTMARAAEVAGVSVRSLQRWQRDPVFHAAVLLWTAVAVVLVHAAGALKHLLERDGVFQRMWFAPRR